MEGDGASPVVAAGSFSTPIIKRKRGETADSSESSARYKRRQLVLGSAELREKEEKLRKLRLVSHYRKNHSLSELAELTRCWREAAQQALTDLQQQLQDRGQQADMAELLKHLGVDPQLVGYDVEDDSFCGPDEMGTARTDRT